MHVAICGLAPSGKALTPEYRDVNGINEGWGLPWDALDYRYDRLFEMHDRRIFERRGRAYMDRIRGYVPSVPMYMQRTHEDMPASVEYPLEACTAAIKADYYNSSIAYMIALAVLGAIDHEAAGLPRKVAKMTILGVDNATDGEWYYERPCNEFLIGVAKGYGVEVDIHSDSSLLRFHDSIRYMDEIIQYDTRYGYLGGL